MAISMFRTKKQPVVAADIFSSAGSGAAESNGSGVVKAAGISGMKDPVPVVQVYSVRGVEYGMMSIALWVLAATLAWLLLNLVNGSHTFDYLVVPTSALVVCVPVFGWLFLRLKKAELANPNLKMEASKRRWTQTTQFLAFIVTLINLIVFVYQILVRFGTDKKPSETLLRTSLSALVVLVIAGGILAYYWFDEHRSS